MAEIVSNFNLLSSAIHNLLQRVRKLIKFIKKSSVLDRYIRQQIRLKNMELDRPIQQQIKSTKLNNVALDFRIRWNTTYVMISRFISLSSIITDITLSSSIESGLNKNQCKKLRELSFSRLDRLILTALKAVLFPFYHATKLLSGSKLSNLTNCLCCFHRTKKFSDSYER